MRWCALVFGALMCAIAAVPLAVWPAHGGERVYASASDVEPLGPGSRVPSATVTTIRGEPIDLAELTSDRGALLVFYRGGW